MCLLAYWSCCPNASLSVSAYTLVTSHGTEEGFPLPTSCCALREKTQQKVSDRGQGEGEMLQHETKNTVCKLL